ncbi:MAG: Cof-type HAD-IIB family hydrolase [Oscillospiraceae bacterium]|nr:Cof-type HAD-IIB family hydrolase [Oscillospiraceae bacterium]
MKYKMIASDMDGTLLNSSFEISERTKQAITDAVNAGVMFVPATGRAAGGTEFINDILTKDMPFIVFNGASAVMGKTKKVLFDKFLDFELAKEVFEIGYNRGLPMVVWTDKSVHTSKATQETVRYIKSYNPDVNDDTMVISSLEELGRSPVYKIFWTDTAAKISAYQDEMTTHFGGKLNCHSSLPVFLEFVSPDASKGTALDLVSKLYGIDQSEIIAVGDGFNDLSMLKYAGLGVAMGNAHDAVKSVCGHVTFSNDNDGVAAVIEEFLLK